MYNLNYIIVIIFNYIIDASCMLHVVILLCLLLHFGLIWGRYMRTRH